MSETLQPGQSIGILGGGQLGRMLAMAAARLGFVIGLVSLARHRVVVFEPAGMRGGHDSLT